MWEVCRGVELLALTSIISKHIGHEWKALARTLNMTETDIAAIEYNNKFSLKEQIFQLFDQWKRQEGNRATPGVLIEGLENAQMEDILMLLEQAQLIEKSGIGYPVQETPVAPERPRLKVGPIQETPVAPERPRLKVGGGMEDVEVDDGKKARPSKPIASSPEESQRQKIRIKRLARLLSDQTGQGPFEEGDMVMVDKLGYGVVKWLGQFSKNDKSAGNKLIAGIEFDMEVPGGNDGEFGGQSYFTCDHGHGLLLPYDRLKRDDRFTETTETNPTPKVEVVESSPSGQLDSIQQSPAIPDENQIFKKFFNAIGSTNIATSDPGECKLPGCSKPRYVENGQCHEFCGKLHADMFKAMQSQDSVSKQLEFYIPNDHAGLVIGREGKNILEVERATNTVIKLETNTRLPGGKIRGRITGSEENCKKAVLMITQKLSRRVSQQTAASSTMKVPENMVGKVIGKEGSTIAIIKSLSGAQDIKFADRPPPLEAMFNVYRECTITGSHEEIEDAKKLINQVIAGEDIVTNARIAAIMTKLGVGFGDQESDCCLM